MGNKVTIEYAVWKARRPWDLMIPLMMDREPIAPQEGPSDLEIAKQVFDEKMKKMRVKSQKQQEETKRLKEQAETHESRLRKMSTDYDKAKEDKKRLNEEINVLERKFKYQVSEHPLASPKTSKTKCKGSCAYGSVKQAKPRKRSPS